MSVDPIYRNALRKLCINTVTEIILMGYTDNEVENCSSSENCSDETRDGPRDLEDDLSYIFWTDIEQPYIHTANGMST